MGRVIAYRNQQGKLNTTVFGSDVNQNILASSNQGYERITGVVKGRDALIKVLQESPIEVMTYAEYQSFLRSRSKPLRKRKAK